LISRSLNSCLLQITPGLAAHSNGRILIGDVNFRCVGMCCHGLLAHRLPPHLSPPQVIWRIDGVPVPSALDSLGAVLRGPVGSSVRFVAFIACGSHIVTT
jgi:hypothetical protein